MISRVKARACANIALVKYWGKRGGGGNLPATPSISLALDKLVTETEVTRINRKNDIVTIDGVPASVEARKRIVEYLDYWCSIGLIDGHFRVESVNSFPEGSGLASSASGFAALTTALAEMSKSRINKQTLSRLARRGSGSAARSITGGLCAMPTGNDPAARLLMPAEEIPWGMVVAVADEAKKKTGSRTGMEHTRRTSSYFSAWLEIAKRDYKIMLAAIRARDFTEMGKIAEQDAIAMHACMMAARPPLLYWNDTTMRLIKSADNFRRGGLETYVTIDAGANVAFFCRLEDINSVKRKVKSIEGVKSVIKSGPAPGAEVIEWE
jgi:diphosphomevalonate decarboxylase